MGSGLCDRKEARSRCPGSRVTFPHISISKDLNISRISPFFQLSCHSSEYHLFSPNLQQILSMTLWYQHVRLPCPYPFIFQRASEVIAKKEREKCNLTISDLVSKTSHYLQQHIGPYIIWDVIYPIYLYKLIFCHSYP